MALAARARVRYADRTMTYDEPVTRLSAEALCRRFEASLDAGAEGVVASDGDGTLWRGDVGDALFDALVDAGRLRPAAREALATEAREAGLEPAGDANRIATALREAFRGGRIEEARYFALQTWAYAGYRVEELAAECATVLDAFAFERAVRPTMRQVVAWCAARGVPFYLVSASPLAMVLEAARRLELPAESVVAMVPAVEDGVIAPRLAAPPTYGAGKVARLAEVLGGAALLAAFGDNTWDAAMLELAAYPVMVAPKPGLVARLAGFDGVFELEGS